MLREALRGFLHLLIFVDFGCGAVLLLLGVQQTLVRAGEYRDRRGSLFSLRRPLPSGFSQEYYGSWRRSVWLAVAFFAVLAIGALLLWLHALIFGAVN
ncbi:hypothetical protein ACQR0V_20230 [Bradyrhizobium sp. HKCCYLS2058]|uniref:hypothetical protein n=1 Tax=unclassified Bradyrhizobium TaxID=2631580 RepID=UPI0028E966F2|nr:hypothetical protein [Bradyrhizobium sp. SZCCHNS3002]